MNNLFPAKNIHAAFDVLRRFPKVLDQIWEESKKSAYGVCGLQRIDINSRTCEVQFNDLKVKIGLRSGKVLT